jgi:hypothetical protein
MTGMSADDMKRLAEAKLKELAQQRARAEKARNSKKDKGEVRFSVYVPAAKMAAVKAAVKAVLADDAATVTTNGSVDATTPVRKKRSSKTVVEPTAEA